MMETETIAAFDLLARMRFACGDNGTRMQDELEEYLRGLLRDAELYRAMAWQPIETAPKDGTAVLVALPYSDIPHSAKFYERSGWHAAWDGHRLSGLSLPTRWMPLPSAPSNA